MTDTTFTRVSAVIARVWAETSDEAAPVFTPDTSLIDGLGFDSLDHVELTMDLEREFGITISDAEAEQLKTVGDFVRLIDAKLAAVAA